MRLACRARVVDILQRLVVRGVVFGIRVALETKQGGHNEADGDDGTKHGEAAEEHIAVSFEAAFDSIAVPITVEFAVVLEAGCGGVGSFLRQLSLLSFL